MEKTKEVLHTKGELWIDDDGFIAIGSGDNYQTFAEIDSRFYAAEKEANKDEMVLRWNSYKRLIDSNRELKNSLEGLLSDVLDLLNKNDSIKLGTMGMIHIAQAKTAINNAKAIL